MVHRKLLNAALEGVVGEVSSIFYKDPSFGLGGMSPATEDDFYDLIMDAPESGEIDIGERDPAGNIMPAFIKAVNYRTPYELGDIWNFSSFSVPWKRFIEMRRPLKAKMSVDYEPFEER